jgi:hypothetical protein
MRGRGYFAPVFFNFTTNRPLSPIAEYSSLS